MSRKPAPRREHARCAQAEAADAAKEQIGHGKIEESPEDIDCRRGQALSRRRCEGALEGAARDSVNEMGQAVGQNAPPKKYAT